MLLCNSIVFTTVSFVCEVFLYVLLYTCIIIQYKPTKLVYLICLLGDIEIYVLFSTVHSNIIIQYIQRNWFILYIIIQYKPILHNYIAMHGARNVKFVYMYVRTYIYVCTFNITRKNKYFILCVKAFH